MVRPFLMILVGLPGSGKSTYAKDYINFNDNVNNPVEYLSSDGIRKELFGDESIQQDPEKVFSIMKSRAITYLNNGKSVIYDATSLTRKARASIISICPRFVNIICNITWAPIEECIKRDSLRERVVGEEVISRMVKTFQAPFYDEGIDEIDVIYPNNFDFKDYSNIVLDNCKIPHDNPHHQLDIYNHCIEAERYCLKNHYPYSVTLAARLHDIGKPFVKTFKNAAGESTDIAHYYQHQCVGAWMSYGCSLVNENIAWLISNHMEPFFNSKYYNNLPEFLKKNIDLLHEADLAAH